MKKLVLPLSVVVAAMASSALAQQPTFPSAAPPRSPAKLESKADPRLDVSPGELTPDMWFYEQEVKRHDDPKQAVRRNAEFDTAQRQNRMAARRWYGFSNIRPSADPMPFTGDYSPTWRSNTFAPYQWAGSVGGTTVVYVQPEYVRY